MPEVPEDKMKYSDTWNNKELDEEYEKVEFYRHDAEDEAEEKALRQSIVTKATELRKKVDKLLRGE